MKNNTWVTSDQHFFHKNIIKYENRPFENIAEMNEYMVMAWNYFVKPSDVIFFLGDFSFGTSTATKHILKRLNGRKVLVLGNHDLRRSKNWWKKAGFIIVKKELTFSRFPNLIMSHEAIYSKEFRLNIHGHSHSNKHVDVKKGHRYCNVCVECWDYKPILLHDILVDTGYYEYMYHINTGGFLV